LPLLKFQPSYKYRSTTKKCTKPHLY